MRKELVNISKFMSLVLRHKPQEIGLRLDKNGWADIKELMAKAGKKGVHIDIPTLVEVVATNDKKRFSFSQDKTKIRANQGHSVQVDLELTRLRPPDILYHGTATRFRHSIFKKGLVRGKRQYVHLSKDTETAQKVGSRHGTPLILMIETGAMADDGFSFFLSENGVWMTKHVPHQYIKEYSETENQRAMKKVKSCGVLCFRKAPELQFLLLKHPRRWDIPKGHIEQNESEMECALRELAEETGIHKPQITIHPEFRFEDTYFPKYKRFGGQRIEKTLVMFLGEIKCPLNIRTTEHLSYQWLTWKAASRQSLNKSVYNLLQEAMKSLSSIA